ncbi:MAG: hypothetical protein EKK64_05495 [Neisseriaceae bacterium]|nr:MAG: hypothetical protein EKK64_05495 [Neisseriaceae bacterium]
MTIDYLKNKNNWRIESNGSDSYFWTISCKTADYMVYLSKKTTIISFDRRGVNSTEGFAIKFPILKEITVLDYDTDDFYFKSEKEAKEKLDFFLSRYFYVFKKEDLKF